jgi:hypothetical protein
MLISGGGVAMTTKIYFETFASGMRARLDPAYRRVNEIQGRRNVSSTPEKEIKDTRNAFVPFANMRKTLQSLNNKELMT